jgi:hypothetical protein
MLLALEHCTVINAFKGIINLKPSIPGTSWNLNSSTIDELTPLCQTLISGGKKGQQSKHCCGL